MADTLLQTELADLESSLRTLAGSSGVSLGELNSYPHLKEAYDRVRLGVSLLYDTNAYSELTNTLSRLPEPSTIRPDTLGSFLFGCRKVLNSGNAFCSPYCLEALLPPKSTAPVLCCPHQVYILSNGKLRHLNAVNTSSAQIYLADNNGSSKTLTSDQIAELQRDSVTTAELLQLPANNPGPATTLISMRPITEFNNPSLPPLPSTIGSIVPTRQTSSWTWLWVIIIIFIILLVIFGIWWAVSHKHSEDLVVQNDGALTPALFSPRV